MNTLCQKHRLLCLITMMSKLKYVESQSKDLEKQLKQEFSKEFGCYIKKIRKESSLTQEELAYKTGLHSTYIGHIETGTYTPSIFVVWKIAEVLKISLSKFFQNF